MHLLYTIIYALKSTHKLSFKIICIIYDPGRGWGPGAIFAIIIMRACVCMCRVHCHCVSCLFVVCGCGV